jgi:hypothetical protein
MFDITLRANDHFSLLKSSSAYAGDGGLGGRHNSRTESCQRETSRASADFAYGRMTHRKALALARRSASAPRGVARNGFSRPRLRAEADFGVQARA